ncbi:LOW QUALITY PROTEIN: hypothetical protein CFOL_v3_14732, partial [Cephalotus follicularis]
AAKKVLQYLKETRDFMLTYRRAKDLQLVGFTDSDFTGCQDDRKSTSGYVFMMEDGTVSWKTRNNQWFSCSSTKAYRALTVTTFELIWLRWLLQDMIICFSSATPIHCDECYSNYTHNDVLHEMTKNIKIDCHVTRQHLVRGTLKVISVSSPHQITNIFTK